jgi:phosphoribosylamine--glycine ligase
MRILLIGGGGREHALAWKLSRSTHCERLYVAPGNAGIQEIAECVPVAAEDIPALCRFATEQRIDLVVVGPEAPLIAGLSDALQEQGVPCFGPRAGAARIEGSKAFAKQLMHQANVPTAPFQAFDDPQAAKHYLYENFPHRRCVVKADGEALGKGVFVCETLQDALDAVEFLMEHRGAGEAGRKVVIEDRLFGREVSLICLTDGQTVSPLPPARDYKRALEDDRGPNTGGMGCFSPVPDATPELIHFALERIVQPVVHALAAQDNPYQGVLYAGLMVQEGQPYAIEFNCRFGDPEAQVLIPRMASDLVEVIQATIEGKLAQVHVEFDLRAAVCVVLASGGYPGEYRSGLPIEGLKQASQCSDVLIFHAGTRWAGGRVVTSGGRVLSVVGFGEDIAEARRKAYGAIDQIHFEGLHYRKDIAGSPYES